MRCFAGSGIRLVRCLLPLALFMIGAANVLAEVATGGDSAPAYAESIVSVARDGYTVAGLVGRQRNSPGFRHGIALFAGHPGILRLRDEAGRPAFDLRGNFLVRSRRHWLDDETLVVVVDAPSDQWASFTQHFRETVRYGEDMAALLQGIGEQFGVAEWTAVGTSEGSVSAFHAARMNPQLIRRLILSASVFHPSRNGPGLSGVSWTELKTPLLWVHHVDDPCKFTPYRSAEEFAGKTSAPLITVRGSAGWRGRDCEAFTAHGFVGVEIQTIKAMQAWVKSGLAVKDVVRPAGPD